MRRRAEHDGHRPDAAGVLEWWRCPAGATRRSRQSVTPGAGTRAAGRFGAERTIEELWNDDVARPVAGGGR